jgi:hypothetical protein
VYLMLKAGSNAKSVMKYTRWAGIMSVDSNPRTAEQILNEIIVLIKQGSPNAIEQIARLILEYKQQSEWDRL